MARIDIAGLAKGYPGSKAGRAVDGIDLAIADGEVMALVGPSGCGKTTTLQLLAGFLKPDAGTISVGERVVSSPKAVVPPERRRMSLIFQSYAVWPHKTVFENVAYGLRVQRLGRSEIEDRVRRVLQTVRLTDLAQRYPGELSGGQQQRVALARAVVVEPETLLLDEPLSNLDANLREEMRFEIRRVHDTTGITMVYVTHDQAEAMVAADRIAIMQLGRIAQVGTARDIYERPASTFVATFIGRTNTLAATLVAPGVAEVCGVRLRVREDVGGPAAGPVTLVRAPARAAAGAGCRGRGRGVPRERRQRAAGPDRAPDVSRRRARLPHRPRRRDAGARLRAAAGRSRGRQHGAARASGRRLPGGRARLARG